MNFTSNLITAVKNKLEAKGYSVRESFHKSGHQIGVNKNVGNNVVRQIVISSDKNTFSEGSTVYVQYIGLTEDRTAIAEENLGFFSEAEENLTFEALMKKVNEALKDEDDEKKNIIGYFNQTGWTDIHSQRVYEKDGKFYLVHVEKRVGKVKPEFHVGGFAAHCSNQDEVWDNGIIVETSEPEEIFKNEKGEFYTIYHPCKDYFVSPDRLEATKENIKAENEGKNLKFEYYEDRHLLLVFNLTKTGKLRTRKNILGKPEATCRYFYDYNF